MARLSVGDSAPPFTVVDADDAQVTFELGRSESTLIAFLRFSTCPFCNLAIHRLAVEYPILKSSGIGVIAFIQSSKQSIREHILERHAEKPPFPIIPRQNPDVYALYDVNPTLTQAPSVIASIPAWIHRVRKGGLKEAQIDGNLFLAPALFLVRPDGRLALAKYSANLYDHALFSEVYDAAATVGV